jgi:hypothetical protein
MALYESVNPSDPHTIECADTKIGWHMGCRFISHS